MLNKFIDLERLTTFFQGLKDIFLQKSEASTTYATKTEINDFKNSKGQAGGIAELDNTGKVPASQLPNVQIDDLSSYATIDYVNTKNTVNVLDTRNEAYTPLWYLDNHESNIMYELKSKTVVGDIRKATKAISVTDLSETTNDGIYVVGGIPNESHTINNDYYMVATFIPLDKNGGYPMQILYSNPMAVRYGESDTLWGEWSTITTSDTEGVKTVLSFDDTTNDGIYVIGGQ